MRKINRARTKDHSLPGCDRSVTFRPGHELVTACRRVVCQLYIPAVFTLEVKANGNH